MQRKKVIDFEEDENYPEGTYEAFTFAPKRVEVVKARRFIPETFDVLKDERWIKYLEQQEDGSFIGIVEYDDMFGRHNKEVHLGEWLVLDHTITVMSDVDFREHFERRDRYKHNCDINGKYPQFVKGDSVKFISPKLNGEDVSHIRFTVIDQMLHYDCLDEFWGNVILENPEKDGNPIRVHCWTIEHA